MDFKGFPKIERLNREIIITEKIDGTNAQITITEDGQFLTGSRTRWITPEDDNFGFSKWSHENKDELLKLGVGTHFGEWWGSGIQRNYGLKSGERRFSLFNVTKWDCPERPKCCQIVPVLYKSLFSEVMIDQCLQNLKTFGSKVVPGFPSPEGIIIYHTASKKLFKVTLENDSQPKGVVANEHC